MSIGRNSVVSTKTPIIEIGRKNYKNNVLYIYIYNAEGRALRFRIGRKFLRLSFSSDKKIIYTVS